MIPTIEFIMSRRTYPNGYQDKVDFWSNELKKSLRGESKYTTERCQGSYLWFYIKQMKQS